jgi:hypothetical protein
VAWGWQHVWWSTFCSLVASLPHSVRGAIAGALKKKHGLDVISEKDDKRGRIYRIANSG